MSQRPDGGLPTRSGVRELARYGLRGAQVGPQEQGYSIIHKSYEGKEDVGTVGAEPPRTLH